jgi:hypothetical protein
MTGILVHFDSNGFHEREIFDLDRWPGRPSRSPNPN